MRISPVICRFNNRNQANKQQMQFERKNNLANSYKYTGVASADLAYASMYNQSIAKDLKLMGLI